MKNSTYIILLLVLLALTWLDFISDRTALWIFVGIGIVGASQYIENRLDDLEDRIYSLERKHDDDINF